MKNHLMLALIILSLGLAGCASNNTQQQAQQYNDPKDPLEGFNRTMWDFNWDVLDKYILRPAAVGYVNYVPGFARSGLSNMASNLEEPANALNNLLQGKVGGTLVSVGRFALNSTVGLLGTIDVASELGLEEESEDFGQTLGVWGAGTGPYVMMPGWGPTDIRSGTGDFVDNSYFPLSDLNIYLSIFRFGIQALEGRAALIEQEQQLNATSDPYIFVKEAYFQNLEFNVKDGEIGEISDEEQAEDEELDALLDDF